MTKYVTWNTAQDAAFRSQYEQITGEAVQAAPLKNDTGEYLMIGSSRITPVMHDLLSAVDGAQLHDGIPGWWVDEQS